MKIITHYNPPPIPIRSHDWVATLDDYEPGAPVGYGQTSAEAIEDLKLQLEDDYDCLTAWEGGE